MFYEEDIPRPVKDALREFMIEQGLYDKMGIKGLIMAERELVWHVRNPGQCPTVGWDARISYYANTFCAIVDDGMDMMVFVMRPFDSRDRYTKVNGRKVLIEGTKVGDFVQASYALTNFMKAKLGGMRPETVPLMEEGMTVHELYGPKVA